jgi:hypothetical protein
MAQFQRPARSPPSRPRHHGDREHERGEEVWEGLALATGVWGRGDVLERASALIGGRMREAGVREREGKNLCKISIGSHLALRTNETSRLL